MGRTEGKVMTFSSLNTLWRRLENLASVLSPEVSSSDDPQPPLPLQSTPPTTHIIQKWPTPRQSLRKPLRSLTRTSSLRSDRRRLADFTPVSAASPPLRPAPPTAEAGLQTSVPTNLVTDADPASLSLAPRSCPSVQSTSRLRRRSSRLRWPPTLSCTPPERRLSQRSLPSGSPSS